LVCAGATGAATAYGGLGFGEAWTDERSVGVGGGGGRGLGFRGREVGAEGISRNPLRLLVRWIGEACMVQMSL
jgi:hypothetical protein